MTSGEGLERGGGRGGAPQHKALPPSVHPTISIFPSTHPFMSLSYHPSLHPLVPLSTPSSSHLPSIPPTILLFLQPSRRPSTPPPSMSPSLPPSISSLSSLHPPPTLHPSTLPFQPSLRPSLHPSIPASIHPSVNPSLHPSISPSCHGLVVAPPSLSASTEGWKRNTTTWDPLPRGLWDGGVTCVPLSIRLGRDPGVRGGREGTAGDWVVPGGWFWGHWRTFGGGILGGIEGARSVTRNVTRGVTMGDLPGGHCRGLGVPMASGGGGVVSLWGPQGVLGVSPGMP